MMRASVAISLALIAAACTGADGGGGEGAADADRKPPTNTPSPTSTETPLHSDMGVAAPDGDTAIDVFLDGGQLFYEVRVGDVAVIQRARLAISFADASWTDEITVASVGEAAIEHIERDLVAGKTSSAAARVASRTLELANGAGDHIALDLVAFEGVVAHRFHVLANDPGELVADASSFAFGDATVTKYVQAYDTPDTYTPASEALFSKGLRGVARYPAYNGWSFPALFAVDDHWVLVTETGVAGYAAGSRLVNEADSSEHVLAQPWHGRRADEHVHGPATTPALAAGDALPWKVVVVSEQLADIVETSAVELLAPAAAIDDTDWIRPGRVSWGWWSDSTSPTNPAALRAFIDLAAELGWEYSLVDANWNLLPDGEIEALVTYAVERDVELFLWYNSGGDHNTVTEQPRDRMADPELRRSEMAWLRDIGVAGIKVDFFHSDRASMNQYALSILRDAADHELLVNFHGITSPKGWHATWPNLLTTEAVRGAEQYKFDPTYPARAARNNVVLAFTRNVVGPMDYTPVTLSTTTFAPLTTTAHELALGIVFESGLQHFADSPATYLGLPMPAQKYLADVPAAWDETRLLDGHPDTHVVIARRSGDQWWVGAINGTDEPLTTTIDLTGLDLDDATLIGDHDTQPFDAKISRIDGPTLTVALAPRGGAVIAPLSKPE